LTNGAPVVVALGSNVGDSLAHLQDAVALLREAIAVDVVSSVYRTEPMYVENQPPFLNAVLTGRTDFGPRTLLARLKEIENEIGRQKTERYGPREIDLDLIAFGSLRYEFDGGDKPLSVPHPKVIERRFVLVPLVEIDPGYKLVGLGTAEGLLRQTKVQVNDVQRLDHAEL